MSHSLPWKQFGPKGIFMGMAGLRSGLTCASRTFFLQGQAVAGKEQGGVPPHGRSSRSDNKKRAGPVQCPPGHHDGEPWRCISRCGQFHFTRAVKPGIHLPTFPQVFSRCRGCFWHVSPSVFACVLARCHCPAPNRANTRQGGYNLAQEKRHHADI